MRTATKLSCLTLSAMAVVWAPAVPAQNRESREPVNISTPSTPQGAGSKLSAASSFSKADQKLLVKLTEGNLAEVETAKTALSKSTDAQVKAFAQHMMDDHGAALKEISALAALKDVGIPEVPDKKHQRINTRLEGLSPAEFDGEYAKAAVEDHRATLKLLDKIRSSAKDAEFKALAEKLKPTVQAHFDMAKRLKGGPSQ